MLPDLFLHASVGHPIMKVAGYRGLVWRLIFCATHLPPRNGGQIHAVAGSRALHLEKYRCLCAVVVHRRESAVFPVI